MTTQEALNKAERMHFGPTARGILRVAAYEPVNPFNYFGHSLRRSWSYAYFRRLEAAGLLCQVDAPIGRRGHRWYVLA